MHVENYGVYGRRKIWAQLNREGIPIGRDRCERLMKQAGITGVVRGRRHRTTVPDRSAPRAPDLVERNWDVTEPNRVWVTDFTYVRTWAAMVYVAFVIDVYSRRIVGWRVATSMKTDLVLDALEHAIWSRDQRLDGLICHSDAGSQYVSIRYTERLGEIGAAPSIGSVGDPIDNAVAESTIGLYKTELVGPQRPWRNVDEVEFATFEYVDWFNQRRLHSEIGHLPPAELEARFYDQQPAPEGQTQRSEPSRKPRPVHCAYPNPGQGAAHQRRHRTILRLDQIRASLPSRHHRRPRSGRALRVLPDDLQLDPTPRSHRHGTTPRPLPTDPDHPTINPGICLRFLTRDIATITTNQHLWWSGPDRTLVLNDETQRRRAYEIILREGNPADIETTIDGLLLIQSWPHLVVPADLRAAWQPLIDHTLDPDHQAAA